MPIDQPIYVSRWNVPIMGSVFAVLFRVMYRLLLRLFSLNPTKCKPKLSLL